VSKLVRSALLASVLLLLAPSVSLAAVRPGEPNPSDLLTVRDGSQLTGLRVALPKPSCTTNPSDCAELDVLNTLDGFNVDARVSIPFSGAIDLATVRPDTVFLADRKGRRVQLERLVWTAATNTLHGYPAVYLDQHTTYVLAVTNGVKAADGSSLDADDFHRELVAPTEDKELRAYRRELHQALHWTGVPKSEIATAGLFTTQSITSLLEKVRRQIDASEPAPVTFALGPAASHTVFPFASVTSVTFTRQTGTSTFTSSSQPFPAVPIFPGAIGTVAYGKFSSPDYELPQRAIPAYPTGKHDQPVPQRANDLYVNLYLPSGPQPAGGWPVAIFGHGFTDSKQGAPVAIASTMAQNGIATIAINVVGHGGGALGTLTIARSDGPPVTFPAGGRGIDQDGNGTIGATEGVDAAAPFQLVGNRDGLRQTVIDLMQLVREIQVGVDVDGDGRRELDPERISYFGQSFGGIYGTTFMAVEPDVHAGVVNVPGGSILEIARLSPAFRPLVGFRLLSRVPSLYNAIPNPTLTNFVENMPLHGQPVLVDAVPGADAIQANFDWAIWAQALADPVAYAPHVRWDPLAHVDPKAIIVQFAKGDQTVPNPTSSALIRAGRLEDRATYFRNDIAFATVPGYTVRNPHTFLTNISGVPAPFAVSTQQQIATFFGSDGTTTIDPDGAGPLWEVPISGPLPETLNLLP
jgi:Bacterial Ig-like domain